MRRSSSSKSKGFTLVELIVGMTLMGIVFAGAFSGIKTGFDVLEEARDHTRVTQMLQSELERLRTLNWNDLSSLPSTESVSLEGALAQAYRDRYTFTRQISSSGSDRYLVTVIASWENSGRERSLSMSTLYAKNGLYDYYYRAF